MSRKPLSARNQVEHGRGQKGSSVKSKKERPPFPLLDKASLVQALRHVLQEAGSAGPPLNFCEDDLVQPTPERIQQVYFCCLDFAFEVSPDSFKQPSFQVHVPEHPELQDDFVTRFQFFRAMKRLMHVCLVNDFKMEDICKPEYGRTKRNLSAIINFFKFHFSVWLESGGISEYAETSEDLREEYSKLAQENSQLQDNYRAIQQQRRQEHDLEEELKQQLLQEEQEIGALKTQTESYQQQLEVLCQQKAKCEQRMNELKKELEKCNVRSDELRKQVVSSPDKLKALLAHLQEQVKEAKGATEEIEGLIRMWESLVSRAGHIPPVLKGLNEDFDLLVAKVKKRSENFAHLEAIEEKIGRKKQIIREATAKHQNLFRHVKLVEEELEQMPHGGNKMPHFYAKDHLERDVCLLQQELEQKELADVKVMEEIEAEKEKLSQDEQEYEKTCSEVYEAVGALKGALFSQIEKYSTLMEQLDINLNLH